MANASADAKLVDMARTDADKKAAQKRMEECMTGDGPDYSYGLCIDLGKEELGKLGISELPEVGDEMHIYAVAKVTRVHQSASEHGDDNRGVTLQITHMSTMAEEAEAEEPGERFARNAKKLYGSKEA